MQKRDYTYVGCTNGFGTFQEFAEWFRSQEGYGRGFQVDKDIVVKGNKVYSPETCIVVPGEVNRLFTKRNAMRGNLPIGVAWFELTSRYRAQCSDNGKLKHLGYFHDPVQAFEAYKVYKEALIKRLADKWKDVISCKAYDALYSYSVEITD